MTYITISVPPATHRALKIRAAQKAMTLIEVINCAITALDEQDARNEAICNE